MNELQTRVRSANPYSGGQPEPQVVQTILDQVRVGTSPTITVAPKAAPPARSGPLWAVAVFAAAIVLFGAGVLIGRGTSGPTRVGALSLAEAYIDARNNYDVTNATALLGANAQVRDIPVMASSDELPLAFRYLEAVGERFLTYDCGATGPTTVTCEYVMQSELRSAVGSPPIEGRLAFVIERGEIIHVSNSIDAPADEIITVRWLEHLGGDTGYKTYYRLVLDDDANVIASPRLTGDLIERLEAELASYLGAE